VVVSFGWRKRKSDSLVCFTLLITPNGCRGFSRLRPVLRSPRCGLATGGSKHRLWSCFYDITTRHRHRDSSTDWDWHGAILIRQTPRIAVPSFRNALALIDIGLEHVATVNDSRCGVLPSPPLIDQETHGFLVDSFGVCSFVCGLVRSRARFSRGSRCSSDRRFDVAVMDDIVHSIGHARRLGGHHSPIALYILCSPSSSNR
jgi:hypothetical protein